MDKKQASEILDVKESTLSYFCEIDLFNNNKVEGYICRQTDHRYGALIIFKVNDIITEVQKVYATPKLKYPFGTSEDGDRVYHWPRFKAISVYDKLDGCLDAKTILETEDGPKTIQDICETQYKGRIKALDIDDQKIIFDKIVNYSVQENNDDWYEITLQNGQKIKLTGNHKVWLPELMCYREVKDLKGNEKILIL